MRAFDEHLAEGQFSCSWKHFLYNYLWHGLDSWNLKLNHKTQVLPVLCTLMYLHFSDFWCIFSSVQVGTWAVQPAYLGAWQDFYMADRSCQRGCVYSSHYSGISPHIWTLSLLRQCGFPRERQRWSRLEVDNLASNLHLGTQPMKKGCNTWVSCQKDMWFAL